MKVILQARPPCTLGSVQAKVLQVKVPHELCPLLLVGCILVDLAPSQKLPLRGDHNDSKIIQSKAHHLEFQGFLDFASAANMKIVDIPGVTDPSNTLVSVELADAKTIFESAIFTGDLALLASELHTKFLLPLHDGTAINNQHALEYIPNLLVMMQKFLTDFEVLLQSDAATSIEEKGIQIGTPMVLLRSWRDGVSCFCGRTLVALLSL